MKKFLRQVSPLIPYLTVGLGVFVFHNAWVAILSYHVGMLGLLFLSGYKISLRRAYSGKTVWLPVLGAVAGAASGIALYFIWPMLSIPADISKYVAGFGINSATWPFFLVYFILVNPFIEEYFWRGYLASPSRFFTLNDVLFAGYHLLVLTGQISTFWLIGSFAVLTIAAWAWRQVNRVNGGILASTVSHWTADIMVILTIYWFAGVF